MAQNNGNLFKGPKRGNSNGNGGKNYDIMNPEASDPNAQRLAKQAGKEALKILKKVAELVQKLLKKFVEFLINLGPLGIILLILLIILVVQIAYQHIPGQMKNKLLEFFGINFNEWFSNGAVDKLDDNYQDIIDVANYLEEMGYSLIGDGFVRPQLENTSNIIIQQNIYDGMSVEESPYYGWTYGTDSEGKGHFYDKDGNIPSISYYDNLGRTVNNTTGELESGSKYTDEYGLIRDMNSASSENGRGKIAEIDAVNYLEAANGAGNIKYIYGENDGLRKYRLLRTYLLSNYRIYTLKNNDEKTSNMRGVLFRLLTGGDSDGWAKGLIKLYNATNGIAKNHWWAARASEFGVGDAVKIDGKTLSLKKTWFNNPMTFSIEGWAPRYGLSLEFLLSLHLGTNAPDLVYAMLQNFDTEIQVYLDDSGKARVIGNYVDPNAGYEKDAELDADGNSTGNYTVTGDGIDKDDGVTLEKIQKALSNYEVDTIKEIGFDNLLSSLGKLIEANNAIASAQLTDWGSDIPGLLWANEAFFTRRICQYLLTNSELNLVSPDWCLGAVNSFVRRGNLEDPKIGEATSIAVPVGDMSGEFNKSIDLDSELNTILDEFDYNYEDNTASEELCQIARKVSVEDVEENGNDFFLRETANEYGFDEYWNNVGGSPVGLEEKKMDPIDAESTITPGNYDRNGGVLQRNLNDTGIDR